MTIFVVKTRIITSLKFHPVFKTGKQKIELNQKKFVKDLRIWYGVYLLFMHVIKMNG